MKTRRRFFVPEVVQSSGMDCGPAALKSLLEGFGIHASYGRLREACQTDVDGSSIDTLEELARQLGLDAEQIMLPPDHLLLPEAQALPAIVVVRLPNGATHFEVVWRRHGPWLQLMDPGTGRRWVWARRFLEDVYLLRTPVPADGWREWAGSDVSRATLLGRLRDLGVAGAPVVEAAIADPGWRKLGALDAGVRLLDSLIQSGGLRKGRQAARLLERFLAQDELIPKEYWSVRAHGPEDEGLLLLRGAVLVRVRGKLAKTAEAPSPLPPELKAALEEKPPKPGRELLHLMRADGILAPAILVSSMLLAAGAVILETVLFRGLFDLGAELGLSGQRVGAIAALFAFLLLLLLLEYPMASSLLRMGRHLEVRLRLAFLEKIPLLGDRYFQSRLKSDMTERSHSIYRLRLLPQLGSRMLRSAFELVFTAAGIAWLDPRSAPLAFLAAVVVLGLPLAVQPLVSERDLRVRNHTGALCRYYLDAMLGLVPIRVHGAQQAVRREHGNLLLEWAGANFALYRVVVWVEALQFAAGFGLAAWLLLQHLGRVGEGGSVLLLAYWALNMPVLGQDAASIAWQYPSLRNMTLRLLEPLGALEEQAAAPVPAERVEAPAMCQTAAQGAAEIRLENVTVRASGHIILENLSVDIPAGAHIGIVGPSGAGKSSLVGTLLGWWKPASGRVLVDGQPLEGRLEDLRRTTAWVDPEVHLWNRTFFDNIRYGAPDEGGRSMMQVIEAAHLRRVLENLPDGFETRLGEGGALVSGGEGQRVRLARALFRPETRLAILDEPFRGLDREQRRELLDRVRLLWSDVTLLCITHDLAETQAFDRVLVVEGGRIVEDDDPIVLGEKRDSRYRALLDAERDLRQGAWSNDRWRRLRLEEGTVREVIRPADIRPADVLSPLVRRPRRLEDVS